MDFSGHCYWWKGNDIYLPCQLQGEPVAVEWVKETISRQPVPKARFVDGIFENWEKRFNIDKNFSLLITDLKVADEGVYFCQVFLTNFENFEKTIVLTISSSVVGTAPNVQGWKGEDIRLQCDIQEEPLALSWIKESTSDQELWTTKAEFFDGKFESKEKRFNIDKDFSLVISDLEVADEGRYYCQVELEVFQIVENSTLMTVSCK
ncbi:neogenin-like [Diadema antillarum]|uniref:neogenin-like n=1 Tax=Diadema antillarum TaxID=105358 RepID=UPI003A899336